MVWIYGKFTPDQLQKIRYHVQNARYQYLLLSIAFGVISHLSRAYRWKYLLEPLGYRTRFYNNVMTIGISFLMNLVIPRMGEFSRALALKKYEAVPFEKSLGTIVAERVVDALILLLLVLITLYVESETIKDYLSKHIAPGNLLIALVVLAVLIIALLYYLQRSNSPWSRRAKAFLAGFKEGALIILTIPKKRAFALHTLLIWSMYFGMFYVAIFALPETASISLAAVMSGFVMGGIVMVFTNGGFAYYPIVVAQIIALYQVPYETGTAFGWLLWTSQFVMIVSLGALSFLLLPLVNRKKPPADAQS